MCIVKQLIIQFTIFTLLISNLAGVHAQDNPNVEGMTVFLPLIQQNGAISSNVDAEPTNTPPVDELPEVQAAIVGGGSADLGEYPWQAWLTSSDGSVLCGGSLIDRVWVLTAAHCLDGTNAAYVVLGDHDRSVPDGEQWFRVVSTTTHPSYIYNPYTVDNDIGLVKLGPLSIYSPLPTLNTRVNLIPLVVSPSDDALFGTGRVGTATGWGDTSSGGQMANILQEVTLAIVSNAFCNQYAGGWITNNMFCAGFPPGGASVCNGDSGGPFLVRNEASSWKQAGIVSAHLGQGCAKPNTYSVFTRISNYTLSWIEQHFEHFGGSEGWTANPYYGTDGTFFADVTGDSKADAIVVNYSGVTVRRSTGRVFSPNESWTNNPYYGTRGTFFADVTGDGRADAIVVNDSGITVRLSTGDEFSGNEEWTTNPYYGTRGTFFADVTGDGKADAIVVNDDGITVRRSTGSAFGNNETWTRVPYDGTRGTFFADVDGDHRADVIVVNDYGIAVRRSTGFGFGCCDDSVLGDPHSEIWLDYPLRSELTFTFADADGDGKADAIFHAGLLGTALNVLRSTGSAFPMVNDKWSSESYNASRGIFFADVGGDGRADAIIVNDTQVVVRRSG